ncbi:tRNA (adenosine(37)-N6)-threonylcarbamoyltransferase complex ATPase subunit type 1 TsaE [bacterium]|nr:MAG: tRNA (adenosine(37)-N6)-threonylcarbamoyltransferase complex ATPase subunit type 1 TsaE [bacterium]
MIKSRNEEQTRAIGREIGKRLKPGDIVCLYGDLGAGKTTMVKGIASSMGIDEREITSPSFTLIAEHHGTLPFYHIDLYRLDRNSVSPLGLEDYLYGEGVSVIEWAERADQILPEDIIRVEITYTGENKRNIEIEGMRLNGDA